MTKIKLSLPSGSEVEKTVLSYFNNGGNYLVLDAESVGSMGLPIILVSKVSDKVEKIIDQNEWQQVKGYLKNIISGGSTTYLAAPETIPADETYYTQLTLPVASFDALKNNYVAPAATAEVASQEPATDVVAAAPVEEQVPSVEPAQDVAPIEAAPSADITNPAPVPSAEEPAAMPEQPMVTDIPAETEAPAAVPAVSDIPVEGDIAAPTPEVGVDQTANSTDMAPVNMSTEIAEDPVDIAPVPSAEEPAVPVIADVPAEEPIANEGLTSSVDTPVVSEAPVVDVAPVVADVETPIVEEAPTADAAEPIAEAPVIAEQPIVEETAPIESPMPGASNIDEIKQKFMSVCEELFDYLASLK